MHRVTKGLGFSQGFIIIFPAIIINLSSCYLSVADSYYWYTYLQRPTDRHITDFILDQYDVLFSRYMVDRCLVPEGRLHELSFDELESDPIASLRDIYYKFG